MEFKMETDPAIPVTVKKEEDHPDLYSVECKMEVDQIKPVSVKEEEPEDIKPSVNSPGIISIKHEDAEDCKDLNIVNVCKEEICLTQEGILGPVKEEPQAPQIKEEPVDIFLIPEGHVVSTMPAVKIEVADHVIDGNVPSNSSDSASEATEEGDEWEVSSDDYTFVPISEIKPYMFEPEDDSESEDGQSGQDENPQQQRLLQDVSAWCMCGKCSKMQTEKANICCHEIPKVVRRMNEVPNTTCMTDHPGFEVICLNGFHLQYMHNVYKENYGRVKRKTEGERYRFLAQTGFVSWCWGSIQSQVLVDLPSCVVGRILQEFPDSVGNDGKFRPPLD